MENDFKPNRNLLNPKFEGYKFDPILQEQAVSRYTLSKRPTQATTSTRLPLAFEEMRSRITYNHLSVNSDTGTVIYVDNEFNVCHVVVPTEDDTSPNFRVLYKMPTDTGNTTMQREYPSCAFLGSEAVAVADGTRLLYILPIKDDPNFTEPVGIFTLPTAGGIHPPFRIHFCHRPSPILAVLLLSSRHYSEETQKSVTGPGQTHIEFDIWAVQIKLLSLRPNPQQQELEILWHRRGRDVPIYTTFVEELNAHLLIGGSPYPDANFALAKPFKPYLEELAPIPRADENLDTCAPILDRDTPARPYPYSWMQTSDTVTVAFPLPSDTPKTNFKAIFTTQTLTLHVTTLPLQIGGIPIPVPHYTTKALWDDVNVSSCFWTWDREAEHVYGLLTLHMEKKNQGTRWMQVFAAAPTSTGKPDEDVEVPESVDPSELVKIREALEKWTGSLLSGEDTSGLGLGSGVPNLMEGEMDEEADTQVGRKAWLTWIGEGGQTPDWSRSRKAQTNDGKQEQWEDLPVTLLSTPLPGSVVPAETVELVLKHDLDGTVFSLKVPEPSTPLWEHTSTYSALSFVLASKRDTRFTYHVPSRGVLAFEGGSVQDRGANVYMYRPTGNEKWAKQSVLQVNDGKGGALLGVGCVKLKTAGEIVLVCLTEGELVLIKGV